VNKDKILEIVIEHNKRPKMSSADEMQYQHLKKYMKDFEEKGDASCCDRVKFLEKQLDRYKRGLKPFITHKPMMPLTRTATSNRKNGSLTDFGGKRKQTKRHRYRRSYSRNRRGGRSRKGKKGKTSKKGNKSRKARK